MPTPLSSSPHSSLAGREDRPLPVWIGRLCLLALISIVTGVSAGQATDRPSDLLILVSEDLNRNLRSEKRAPVRDRLERHGVTRLAPLSDAWPGTLPPLASRFRLDRWYVATLEPGVDEETARSRIVHEPGVELSERALPGEGGDGQALPTDSFSFDQWRLRNIGQTGGLDDADVDAVEAWTMAVGRRETTVAVLDSGIDGDHLEFRGRILPGGHDTWNSDLDPEDDNGHGTKVSGLAVANANNRFAVTGVNWRAGLLPMKVLNHNQTGNVPTLIDGLLRTAAAGPEVVNLSLIRYPESEALHDAIRFLHAAGAILIGCNGNDGIDEANYPASYDEVLAVGWSTDFDLRAPGSNFTSTLDLLAPGRLVRTAAFDTTFDARATFSGCSAAAPTVAGGAALLLALDPTLTFEQLREILRSTADDEVGDPSEDLPGRDNHYGWGRLNLDAALRSLGLARETRVHVDEIAFRTPNATRLEVEVTILNARTGVVANANVIGRLNGPEISDLELSATTGSNGVAVLEFGDSNPLPPGGYTFAVDDVDLAGHDYEPSTNRVTSATHRPGFNGIHVRSIRFETSSFGLAVRVQVVDDDGVPEGDVDVSGLLTRPGLAAEPLEATTRWAAGGVATFIADPSPAAPPGEYRFDVSTLSKAFFEHETGRDEASNETLTVIDAAEDPDNDTVAHADDNCPSTANQDQSDEDLDGIGDACDLCPRQVDFAQKDHDADGFGDRCDCAPFDPERIGLGNVDGLTLSPDRRTLSWFGVSGADRYDLLRGLLSAIDGSDYGACLGENLTTLTFDDSETPAPGEGFFYLLRADDEICGPGGLGEGRLNENPAGCS